jgi:hypothetical protein
MLTTKEQATTSHKRSFDDCLVFYRKNRINKLKAKKLLVKLKKNYFCDYFIKDMNIVLKLVMVV